MDATLKDSILRLYRSAVHVGGEWEGALGGVTSRALVLWGIDDPACPFSSARNSRAMGGTLLELQCGHWTLEQKPDEVAPALEQHWRAPGSVGRTAK